MVDTTTQQAVVLDDVTKRYPGREAPAVDGVSIVVEQGEILSLLGPNGAGKSTTLEMLVGLRTPTSGTVRVLGLDPVRQRDDIRARVAVQPQHAAVFDRQTVRELLRCWASFYVASRPPEEVIDRLGLGGSADVRIAKLSGGQRQRVLVGLALVSDPELLVLDEPSTGMDPNARQDLWETVADYRSGGGTVILSTHLMEEAESVSDRVAILDHGRLAAADTAEALVDAFAPGSEISAVVPDDAELAALAMLGPQVREQTDARGGRVVTLVTSSSDAALKELAALDARQIRVRESGLAGVFRALTGRTIDGDRDGDDDGGGGGDGESEAGGGAGTTTGGGARTSGGAGAGTNSGGVPGDRPPHERAVADAAAGRGSR